MTNQLLLKQLKAISEAKRLDILKLISKKETCACILLENLDLTQSGLSYHMKLLSDAKIVNSRQEGKWTYYTINNDFKENLTSFIDSI